MEKINKIAILTSKQSWFFPYAIKFVQILGQHSKLFTDYKNIANDYDIVFILSYFHIIPEQYLKKHKHNLVVHESDLPKGKGWSPLFWQILEGKKKIPIVLFEASRGIDEGDIYIKDFILFEGHELHDEIRKKQAQKTIELCLRFLEEYDKLNAKKQKGKSTFYEKRTTIDSELNIDKSLKSQFNLLRIVDNENFPAFFYCRGQKYKINIYKFN